MRVCSRAMNPRVEIKWRTVQVTFYLDIEPDIHIVMVKDKKERALIFIFTFFIPYLVWIWGLIYSGVIYDIIAEFKKLFRVLFK